MSRPPCWRPGHPQKKNRARKKKKGGTVPSTNCQQQGGGPLHQPPGLSTNPMASDRSPHCGGTETPLVDTNQAVTLPSPHPGLTPAPSAPSVVSLGSSPFHGAPVSAMRSRTASQPLLLRSGCCTPPCSQRRPGQQMTHAPCACVSSYLARLGRKLATSGPRAGTRCTLVAWRTCL